MESFPHSRLITGFVTRLTRWVPLVEQGLLTLLEHLSSPPVFSGVRVTRSLVLYICFVDRCLSFVPFLLAIVLSVLLQYTDSDSPFGIFHLFLLSLMESIVEIISTMKQIVELTSIIKSTVELISIIQNKVEILSHEVDSRNNITMESIVLRNNIPTESIVEIISSLHYVSDSLYLTLTLCL